jgi:Cu/Ag efflux protein CusF
MKNLLSIGIVILLAISLTGLTFAQEKAKQERPAAISNLAGERSAEMAKPDGKTEEKQASAQPEIVRMGGVVTSVDPKADTLSIHQETVHHDRVMELKVSKKAAKELSNLRPGDPVNVWVIGKTVTALNRVG